MKKPDLAERSVIIARYHRLLIVIIISLVSGIVCTWYHQAYARHAGDFTWALNAAHDLLHGHDPYARDLGPEGVAYPLPAALVAFPLIWLPQEVAAGVFIGISSGILAWGLTQKEGEYWRLLAFTSLPYWQSVQVANWPPLMLAVVFLPTLFPLTIIKPNIGLPVALIRLSRQRVAATLVFGLASLLIVWNWPLRWLASLGPYAGRSALLVLPLGPLLLLALLAWRTERARYLLFCAVVPFRLVYDYLMLWALPQSRREMLLLVILSWITYFCCFYWPQLASQWVVVLLYLPLLCMVLWAQKQAAAQ